MKISWVLIGALCLLQFTADAQKLPSKQEKYKFLRWYLSGKNLKQLSDTTVPFSIGSLKMKEIDEILSTRFKISKADLKYFNRQIISIDTPSKLDTSVLKEFDWKLAENVKASKSYISMPIFSKNRQIAFIVWGNYCGITCGEESVDVYIKSKRGSWKKSKIIAFPFIMF